MTLSTTRLLASSVVGLALVLAGCGDDEGAADTDGRDRPTVVVTTNILGDVVENLVGDAIDVVTIMPIGSDPHDFQASAQQVAQMGGAAALIVNGAGFEEGLLDVIESAEADGVPVFEAMSAIEAIEHSDDAHADDEDTDDEHGHDHDGIDPHFFTDPARMARVAEGIVGFLRTTIEGIDATTLNADAAAYIAELEALDDEVETLLAQISAERRVMVTNHEVFGYFAERYGFVIVGAVVPSGSTIDGTSARDLAELAEVIEQEGVTAIFADTSSSDELARTLAAEVGDVDVIALYSESLGADGSDGANYVAMVRSNAQRIADALTR
ncbi:MAG: metal ABC transporter substrate-binding protein [Acidimicrobiales bacterium]